MNLKKGDNVKILSGKDRGKTGKILRALPGDEKVVVDNMNIFKKRSRPKKQGEKGQMVLVSRAMPVSKVMLICSNCKQPTRVGFHIESGKRIRYCKKCKANT
jgi:large subunit ribosomal protein L24